jgi:hypothetical protein
MVTIRNTAFIASLALLFANSASAQSATYDYSGQVMSGTGGDSATLDGTVTLAAPLGPNLSNVSVIPTYAQFGFGGFLAGGFQMASDGYYYVGQGVGWNANSGTIIHLSLDFSTDTTGAIIGWDLTTGGTPYSFQTFTATSTQSGDSAQYVFIEPNFGAPDSYLNYANSTGGSWSGPTAAPEIDVSSATAALTLLAGFIIVNRYGRRPSLPVRSGTAA